MIEVREARQEESGAFLDLVDALADYEKLDRPAADARERLVVDGFGENRRFTPYLGLLDGKPVAYAITYLAYSSFLARPTLFLEDLFVLPDARRHGLGREFFRVLARRALDQGCGRMEWVVLDWNQLAIDFYEGLGSSRLSEWYTYRLTGDQLEKVAGR